MLKIFSRYYDFSLVKKITAICKTKTGLTIIMGTSLLRLAGMQDQKKNGVRTFIHTHNIEHLRFKSTGRWWWPLLKWYEKRCFKKTDGIFFITLEFAKSPPMGGIAPPDLRSSLWCGDHLLRFDRDDCKKRDQHPAQHSVR